MILPPERDGLDVDMAVLGVDGADEQAAAVAGHQGREKGRQGGNPDHRNAGGKPDAARGRNPDPQARIAPGPDRDGHAAEALEACPPRGRSAGRSAAAALPHGRVPSESSRGRESRPSRSRGCRPSRRRGRYRWQERAMFVSVWWRLFRAGAPEGEGRRAAASGRLSAAIKKAARRPPDSPRRRGTGVQTAWTSRTSGRKWRRRFWMPCRRVAVEEGQPEHAPFMTR